MFVGSMQECVPPVVKLPRPSSKCMRASARLLKLVVKAIALEVYFTTRVNARNACKRECMQMY
jgi:hypothetical protein